MMRRAFLHIGLLLPLVTAAVPSRAEVALQPYQMVRSLQLLQDRLAAGDHAVLPMQTKLLTMVDARLREASVPDFEDPRNVRATLIYAMSGGNPATIEHVLPRIWLEPEEKALAQGILDYVQGRRGRAVAELEDLDPMSLQPALGASVALVKASAIGTQDSAAALILLDQARLLGTGTLVEEAALRRSIELVTAQGEQERFLHLSGQYVRRFLRSPYASQFAEAFVAGLIKLHASIDLRMLDDVMSGMESEKQQHIYIELARRAAIRGLGELSAFAAERAKAVKVSEDEQPDQRALLYSSLASVVSEDVEMALERLHSIDRSQLAQDDRRLLDAATAIARETLRPPTVASDTENPNRESASSPSAAEDGRGDGRGAVSEAEPTNLEFVSGVRDKLRAVDRLLQGAAE